MKEEIFSLRPPFGDPLRFYKNRFGSDEFSETLTIVSGLQGDRLNGLWVAARLSRFLQEVEDGGQPGYRISGNIQIFPVVNLRALEQGKSTWVFDHLNMDLAFPGIEEGDLTEKLCNLLVQHSSESDYGLILQTAEPHYEEAPHVRLYDPNRNLRNLARCLGLNVAREIPDSPALTLNLVKQWDAMGIPTLVTSAGRPNELNLGFCDTLYEGIINFMLMAGVLTHSQEKGKKTQAAFYRAESEVAVVSENPGWFVARAGVGEALQQGQIIGEVFDVYGGRTLETLEAPEEGWLVSLRTHPLIHEKEPVATLLTEKNRKWFWPFT